VYKRQALHNASDNIDISYKGGGVLLSAIKAPYKTILTNAGIAYGPYHKEGWGINVITGESCNLIKEGIIDPLLVTKSALRNAASVATTILSTDCIINNLRIDESNR
jgi:chaperonin GroEL